MTDRGDPVIDARAVPERWAGRSLDWRPLRAAAATLRTAARSAFTVMREEREMRGRAL